MLESGSWGHSVLQTPALVFPIVSSCKRIEITIARRLTKKVKIATVFGLIVYNFLKVVVHVINIDQCNQTAH